MYRLTAIKIIEYSTCTEEFYYRPLNKIFMALSSKLFSKINEFLNVRQTVLENMGFTASLKTYSTVKKKLYIPLETKS